MRKPHWHVRLPNDEEEKLIRSRKANQPDIRQKIDDILEKQSAELLKVVLGDNIESKPTNDSDEYFPPILKVTALQNLIRSQEKLAWYFYACDLLNNIGYNWIKLDLNYDKAKFVITLAIQIMIELRQKLLSLQPEFLPWYIDCDERLSLYYDSLAWMYFRRRDRSSLDDSIQNPLDGTDIRSARDKIRWGIRNYRSGLATPHYHLAYIYTASFEDRFLIATKDNATDKLIATELQDYLRKALFHWSLAVKFDTNKRLERELRSLRERIHAYEVSWQKLTALASPTD